MAGGRRGEPRRTGGRAARTQPITERKTHEGKLTRNGGEQEAVVVRVTVRDPSALPFQLQVFGVASQQAAFHQHALTREHTLPRRDVSNATRHDATTDVMRCDAMQRGPARRVQCKPSRTKSQAGWMIEISGVITYAMNAIHSQGKLDTDG